MSLWTGGSILLGHNLAAATGLSVYHSGKRFVTLAERQSRRFLAAQLSHPNGDAWVLRDGVEIAVPISRLTEADVIVLGEGSIVPVDGVVVEGSALIDQHLMTPDTEPVEKNSGDTVLASALIRQGKICIRMATTID